jgi:hypothetical protein
MGMLALTRVLAAVVLVQPEAMLEVVLLQEPVVTE